MAISVDPKIDFAFRYLMTIKGNKPVLRHFLNAALLRPPSQALVGITVGNPCNGRLGAKEKETILDLKATDSTGHQYQVEIELQRPIDKSKELTPLDRWVLFFQEATMWDVDKLPYYMKTPEIIQAVQSLDELSRREEDYDLYRRRFLWLMHEQHIRRDMLHDVSEKLKQAEQKQQQAEHERLDVLKEKQQAERLLALQEDRLASLERQLQQLLASRPT